MRKSLTFCLFVALNVLLLGCGDSSDNGSAPKACVFSPGGLNFGDVAVGTPKSLTLSATCSQDLQLAAEWDGNREYTLSPAESIYSARAGVPLDITVTAVYSSTGGKTSTFNFIASNGETYQIIILGNGVSSSTQSLVEFSKQSLEFNTTASSPTAQSIIVKNITNRNFYNMTNEIIIDGQDSATLGFSKSPFDCSSQLNAGASCTVNIAFTPRVTGNYTGNLVFSIFTDATSGTQIKVPITVNVQ